jgi:hypothetical protein
MSVTRTETDIIGSVASPASIAHGANASGTVDLTATAGTFDAAIGGAVIVGTVVSAGPTVAFYFSLDGTNYIQDGGNVAIPVTASTTTPFGPYVPPPAAKAAKVTINNNDTGTVAITAWAQVTTLSSNNL